MKWWPKFLGKPPWPVKAAVAAAEADGKTLSRIRLRKESRRIEIHYVSTPPMTFTYSADEAEQLAAVMCHCAAELRALDQPQAFTLPDGPLFHQTEGR